jgi:hypothetical protein
MYETNNDERKARAKVSTAYLTTMVSLLASVLGLAVAGVGQQPQVQTAYAQNSPGEISGSGSGEASCAVNGAQGDADIDFDATYDPDTGQVQGSSAGGTITVTGSPGGAGMSSVLVTGGQVVDNGDGTGQFSITGSIQENGACDGPPTTGITTLTGECGENQVLTLNGDVSGTFQGNVDCGLAEEEPPLNEQFPDQGSCIEGSKDPDAGFTKADCKDAFKDKKVKP